MHDTPAAKAEYNEKGDSLSEALKSIQEMLRSAASDQSLFPPTLLYNEGWLLRLVLHWFSEASVQDHPLSFAADSKWFSEALLPSPFLARYRGDKLAENWTHADGVVGHFRIYEKGKTDFRLLPGAAQFLVLEAKMFSSLSSGVTNARYYDQAARNVACMAETLRRADHNPLNMTKLGFYVLAPSSQIERGVFSKDVAKESIFEKVHRRVGAYEGEKEWWFEEWFRPTCDMTNVSCLSWEQLIATINKHDPIAGAIKAFYDRCLKFNQ
jgi:hypothetical protein